MINVIDARQAYPQRVVQRALRRLHHEREADNSIHLSYEVVALTPAAAAELGVEIEEGRESVALSGRRGIEVRADDLLDRAIARLSANARDAESATGGGRRSGAVLPAEVLAESDHRVRLRRGAARDRRHRRLPAVRARPRRRHPPQGRRRRCGRSQPPGALHPAERELLHSIEAYPRALTETALALSPSVLTTYTFGLASAFSDFYEHTPAIVREEDPAIRRFRRAARRRDAGNPG